MLLNDGLNVTSVHTPAAHGQRASLGFSRKIAPVVAFFALAILLQILSGAYRAEFGGYPDAPAHYVTSVMVREYITGPSPFSPLQFAENYYAHYPKVAFGHWPPVFYIVQALWMMLFSCSRASVLLELAVVTAVLAYSVCSVVRRSFGSNAGILAGLLTVCLPLIQVYTNEEMAETLLALLCFWSAIYFARYLDSERWQDNVWFGVFFALAVLLKGSAWLLILVPPSALLVTRKLRLLFRARFWISAAVIAALCLPWQLTTMRLAEEGWVGGTDPNIHYTLGALWQFLLILVQIIGPFLAVFAVIGLCARLFGPMFRRPVASVPAALGALIFADWIFHSLVPAGVEDRKMIMAVPALIYFIFAGGFWIAEHLPRFGAVRGWQHKLVAAAAALIFFLQTFAIRHERQFGYSEAAQLITSNPQWRGAKILVSSGSMGEGLLIEEMAMRQPRPIDTIVRATKALAKVDWNGDHYQLLFSKPTDLLSYLERQKINLVVMDTFGGLHDPAHNRLLRQTIEQSNRFTQVATFSPPDVSPGAVHVYRFRNSEP